MAKAAQETVEVDNQTGEIVRNSLVLIEPSDKRLVAAAEMAVSLKEKAFDEEVNDFWKPTEKKHGAPVRDGDVLQGVYVGFEKVGRLRQFMVAIPHPKKKGAALIMRFNGTHILAKKLRDTIPQGDGPKVVRIEYLGTDNSGMREDPETGKLVPRRLADYSVRWPAKELSA